MIQGPFVGNYSKGFAINCVPDEYATDAEVTCESQIDNRRRQQCGYLDTADGEPRKTHTKN